MRISRSFTVLAVALAAAVLPAAAHAAPSKVLPAKVGAASSVAAYSVSNDTMNVKVRYRCTNKPGQVHYLDLTEQQGSDRAIYVRGARNDSGGVKLARCTGSMVGETVTLLRNSYDSVNLPRATKGEGALSVGLLPRSTADRGGWYVSTGADVYKERSVRVTYVK